jgi:hypothetical protein
MRLAGTGIGSWNLEYDDGVLGFVAASTLLVTALLVVIAHSNGTSTSPVMLL